jgi:hypothetical protein
LELQAKGTPQKNQNFAPVFAQSVSKFPEPIWRFEILVLNAHVTKNLKSYKILWNGILM